MPDHPVVPARIERVAHRGSPKERLENTLPGFLLALEHGADAVELDVHVTSDGVVVVHHDAIAQGREISATGWGELSPLDLGGGTMPRLEQVLQTVGDRATVYIEIKGQAIEDEVIAVARAHGRRYALHSFDHDAMALVAGLAPDIPRGVLLDRGTTNPIQALRRVAERVRPRDVWPHWSLVNLDLVRAAHDVDARVVAWTVNSAETARHLVSLGVDALCGDDVRLFVNL